MGPQQSAGADIVNGFFSCEELEVFFSHSVSVQEFVADKLGRSSSAIPNTLAVIKSERLLNAGENSFLVPPLVGHRPHGLHFVVDDCEPAAVDTVWMDEVRVVYQPVTVPISYELGAGQFSDSGLCTSAGIAALHSPKETVPHVFYARKHRKILRLIWQHYAT